jgi:hypothetical protein
MEHQAFAELLGNYGEFVGAIAVVATLAYLAIQIRQNTRSNRVAAELECLKLLSGWVGRVSASKDAQRLYDLVADGSESLTPEESRHYIWLMGEFSWIVQTAFMQYRRGFLSRDAWAEFERMQVGMLQATLTREWWQNREAPYSTEFTSHIDRALSSAADWRPQITAREA